MSGWSRAPRAVRALGLVVLVVVASLVPMAFAPSAERGALAAPGSASASSPAAPASASSAPLVPSRAVRTLTGEGDAAVVVYPPDVATAGPAPALVVLHGMCMRPEDVCDFWPSPSRGEQWVVCPRGNGVCGGAPDWTGPNAARVDSARRSLAAAWRAEGPSMDPERRVVIGYSRGAYLARDLLHDGHERFVGAVFLGAAVLPDPVRLKAAGVRRAVFAAGDFDGARPTMERAAERLRAGGIAARYVSLGRMGHGLPAELESILREPLAWVAAPEGVEG